jgi:tRNA(Ile)-lysidine synthase
LLAAVSGGADSAALLAALVSVTRNTTFTLSCLHVEHGIRAPEESRGDADFVQALCAQFSVPCKIVSIPQGQIAQTAQRTGLGIEAAARLYRRRALLREARRIEAQLLSAAGSPVRILTAHTRDDLLETVLMRVLRGAGPAGLAAMPPMRGRFLRPLLGVDRAEVLSFLREKNLSWREDSTNADTRFLRNRVRRALIPFLNESFPHWRRGIETLAETQEIITRFINSEARGRVRWTLHPDGLAADAEAFFAQDPAVREEALFRGIDRLVKDSVPLPVKRAAVRCFCAGAANAADFARRKGRKLRARREGNLVILSADKIKDAEQGFTLLIKEPGSYILKGVTIEVRPGFTGVNADNTAPLFSALLPLALRPAFSEDSLKAKGRTVSPAKLAQSGMRGRLWSAFDRNGTAAFIGANGICAVRDFPNREGEAGVTVIVTKR